MRKPAPSGAHPLLIFALFAAMALQMITAIPLKSPTFDEPAHIGAGLSYWRTGTFKVNPQHPPLLKEIGALPLLAMGVPLPMSAADWKSLGPRVHPFFQWSLGRDVIFGNGPDRIMFWTRAPFVLLTLCLGGLVLAWGRRMIGGGAAAGALLLYSFDPNLIAQGPLVATDLGFAAFSVLFFLALWWYLNHRSVRRLVLCGGAMGLMLATKFSAVFFLPVTLAILILAVRLLPAAQPLRASNLADPYASENGAQRTVWSVYAFLAMALLAAVVVELTYFLPRNPFLYVDGLRRINADHDPSYLAFMAGSFQHRFLTYYLICYLLKEPVAAIVLAAWGAWLLLRRGGLADLDRLFLFMPPLFLFLAYTLYSDDLGFRYMIPVLPFLHLAGGAGLAALFGSRRRVAKVAAGILCVWTVVAGTAIYPDHLSYFNEAACVVAPSSLAVDGGWRCGTRWLDDSNVDWGQGMKQLKGWLDAHPPRGPLRLGYFGSIRPENYGLDALPVGVDDLQQPPLPGVYALSAHVLARAEAELRARYGEAPGNWIARTPPVAVVGHAYYVFDIPEGTATP